MSKIHGGDATDSGYITVTRWHMRHRREVAGDEELGEPQSRLQIDEQVKGLGADGDVQS